MKLLIFSPYYPPHVGGLENHAAEFNSAMESSGILTTVVTSQLPMTSAVREMQGQTRIIRVSTWEVIAGYPLPRFWLPSFWRIWRELRGEHFDLVISRTRFFSTSLLALIFSRRHKIPWLHVEHGSDFVQSASPWIRYIARVWDESFGRLILQAADQVVGNSAASCQFVSELTKSGRACHVIHRGVDHAKIAAVSAWKDQEGTYSDKVIITYVGRLISGKGVSDLLQALEKISNNNVVCFIVGDGPQRTILELKAQNRGHVPVVFLGQCSFTESIALLKASDIFVNPSYTEGLPTAVIEAAICGKAIVATDVGGTKEIIVNHKSGLLVPARSSEALAAALQSLIDNPALRASLGAAAQERTINEFSWKTSAEQYLNVFRELKLTF